MKRKLVVICVFEIAVIIISFGCKNEKPSYGMPNEDPTTSADMNIGSDWENDTVVADDQFVVSNIINECPYDGFCDDINAICINSTDPELTGFKSICSYRCWVDPETDKEYVFYMLGETQQQMIDGTCAANFANGASCCGNAIDSGQGYFNYYCVPPEGCCPEPYPIRCGTNCCSIDEKCNQETKICELQCPPPNLDPCDGQCCPESAECGGDGKSCVDKCVPPTPLYCKNECCPNNYFCECEDQGGFCLPGGAQMCDCEDKSWCEPLQECIKDDGCHQIGKICKSLGAEDCPEAENCYCDPGLICTHESPACCASDEPVPCGDYCCPDKNECLTDIKDCLPPGWDYCEQWGTKCGVGLDCKEKEIGCKDDYEEECDYGRIICSATENCVGQGKGVNGCCPTNQEVPCDGYCCPGGTHCEAGCGGCVQNVYYCCPDGVTTCLDYGNGNKQFCYSGGGDCLASPEQDCLAKGFGNYHCNAEEVCSSGPQKCCAETMPQTCGNQCCHTYETCYEAGNGGICVDEQAGEEYCGGFFMCGSSLKCVKGKTVCIPDNAEMCDSNCYCDNTKCCQDCGGSGWACQGNFKCVAKGLDCVTGGYCPPGYESHIDSFIFKPPGQVCCLAGSEWVSGGCEEKYKIDPVPYENVPDASCF